MPQVSQHFTVSEVACHHCGVNGCRPELYPALEKLRSLVSASRGVDTPLIVNDAYRCPVHNAAVGGVPNSQHVQGIAADVRVAGMSAAQLYRLATLVPEARGLGRADAIGYVHIDLRPTSARWCYDAAGRVVPWYPDHEPTA